MALTRIDRLLSHLSGLSRKQARQEIRAGRVRLGGQPLRDPSAQVPNDVELSWSGRTLRHTGPVYLMLHKPDGVVCARRDDQQVTVLDLLPAELARRVHIVGRLDKQTTGLLLLTDDGDWSHRITSPRQGHAKCYRADLAEPLTPQVGQRFAEGLLLRGEQAPIRPARLLPDSDRQVRVILQEGRYHQVRRMFAAVGNRVTRLHRLSIGALELDPSLQPGHWRELSLDERHSVFRCVD